MNDPGLARLIQYRALRDEAWAVVRHDIDRLQGDLELQGIGERIKDRAAEEAQEAWDQARDIASEHKGVVAGTFLALVAWLLRGPIGDALSALFGRDEEGDDEPEAEPPAD
ncbi:MAG: hypothetical protein Q8R44_12070 [Novosphingobium sp.]|nr:hypothetical protein [Novosphingobium sp.]